MLILHISSQKFTVLDGILKFISKILFFLEGALEWYDLLLHAADDTNVLVLVHIGELTAALLLFEGVVFSPQVGELWLVGLILLFDEGQLFGNSLALVD